MQMSPAWPLLGGPFYGMLCAENQSWRELFSPSFSRHITATGRPPYTPMRTPPPCSEKNSFFPTQCTGIHSKSFLKNFFCIKKHFRPYPPPPLTRNVPSLYFSRSRRLHYRSSLAPARTLVAKLPPGDDEPSLSGLLLLLLLDPCSLKEREKRRRDPPSHERLLLLLSSTTYVPYCICTLQSLLPSAPAGLVNQRENFVNSKNVRGMQAGWRRPHFGHAKSGVGKKPKLPVVAL